MIDKNASFGAFLVAGLIWLICLPGALVGLIPAFVVLLVVLLFGALGK